MVNGKDHVATIVLAAGYSSRAEGAFKPLLKLGDYTIIERTITSHLDAGIQDVRVVVGYRADEVIEAVKHLGISIVRNPYFDKGMFSSIQAGAATLEPEVKAFLSCLLISPWLIRQQSGPFMIIIREIVVVLPIQYIEARKGILH